MRTIVTRQRVKTLASILAVSAFSLNIWAQQRNVRLEVKDMQVEQALLKLRKESGYKFLFNHEEVKHAGKKTVSFPGNPLTEVLDALLAGTNLTYRKPELLNRDWYVDVDVSKYAAYFIVALNHDMSVSSIIDPIKKIEALLANRK